MNVKNYKKILKIIKEDNYTNFELITNYGLFSGDTNLYKTIKIFDLVKSIKNIKGDIIEFGTFNGNTGILIAKLLKLLKIKKKIYLFDTFDGLKDFDDKDELKSLNFENLYKGNFKKINKIIKFFDLKNVKIIKGDATKLKKGFFKNYSFSLIIMDMDLYFPTINALNCIKNRLVKNGKIIFDECNSELWKGEKKAQIEFLKKNKNSYRKTIISKKPYQPDVELLKL